MKEEKTTGIMILINQQTGKTVKLLSVVNSAEDTKKTITKAAENI